jgi:phosphatidylglycerophosphate synthase
MSLEKIFSTTLHPNRVSAAGLGLTIAGSALMASPYTDIYGASLIVAGQALDWADGPIARKYDLRTIEGARLDSFYDKLKYCATSAYISINELITGNFLIPLTIMSNIAVDSYSLKTRGPLLKQIKDSIKAVIHPKKCEKDEQENSDIRANIYGKLKVSAQNIATFSYLGYRIYENHVGEISNNMENIGEKALAGLFLLASILGITGIVKRLKNSKNKIE